MQRFTISLDDALAKQFDAWIAQRGYENRSEAARDLLRAELQQTRLQGCGAPHLLIADAECIGAAMPSAVRVPPQFGQHALPKGSGLR